MQLFGFTAAASVPNATLTAVMEAAGTSFAAGTEIQNVTKQWFATEADMEAGMVDTLSVDLHGCGAGIVFNSLDVAASKVTARARTRTRTFAFYYFIFLILVGIVRKRTLWLTLVGVLLYCYSVCCVGVSSHSRLVSFGCDVNTNV